MLGVDLKPLSDRDQFSETGERGKMPIVPGRLNRLSSGRGVALGDTPERVRSIMGRPTWTGGSRFVPGEKVWSYRRVVGRKGNQLGYRALFRFRNGRVSHIELNRDIVDGA